MSTFQLFNVQRGDATFFVTACQFARSTSVNGRKLISRWHAVATRVRGRRRHGEKSKKAKTTKGKLKMKKISITFTAILLVLGCFSLSPAVQAASDSRQLEKFTQIDVPGAMQRACL